MLVGISKHSYITKHEPNWLVLKRLSVAGFKAPNDIQKILLDFSGVSYACSDVIGTLIVLNKRVREKGGRLKLCGICPYVREIFAITKIDIILDIAKNEADALAAFA